MSKDRAIAIIPARKGSKRLPGKNLRLLCGKPLIQWTIEAALQSMAIDEVLITTDDPAVLSLGRALGVRYLLERPAELASDTASTLDVVEHAVKWLTQQAVKVGTICLLQATSPLRVSMDIDEAMSQSGSHGHCTVISVCEVDHPMAWCNTLGPGGGMQNFAKSMVGGAQRSQDLGKYYRLNGAIYITTLSLFESRKEFLHSDALAYIMPKIRSVDVDDIFDFYMAELLMTCRMHEGTVR